MVIKVSILLISVYPRVHKLTWAKSHKVLCASEKAEKELSRKDSSELILS